MLRSVKLGKVFGIPLYVHSTFLLLPLWVLFQSRGLGAGTALFSLVILVALMVCLVMHELGHALMARHFGISTRDITLYPIGGVARLERMSEGALEEICIALAGPAVNLVIVFLLTPLVVALALLGGVPSGDMLLVGSEAGPLTLAVRFLATLWFGNLMLLGFNMLPAFPMDGGRVLRALLSLGLGRLRATELAAAVGLVVAPAVVLGVWYFLGSNPLLVVLILFVCFAGQQELAALRRLEAQRQAEAYQPVPLAPPEPLSAGPAAMVAPEPNFSGLAWDSGCRVWVIWHNGRPISVFGARAE